MVNVKKISKEKTIGPCPCELCSRWYCEERKKKGKLVQQNSGMDRGTIQWMSVHWLYIFLGPVVVPQKKKKYLDVLLLFGAEWMRCVISLTHVVYDGGKIAALMRDEVSVVVGILAKSRYSCVSPCHAEMGGD